MSDNFNEPITEDGAVVQDWVDHKARRSIAREAARKLREVARKKEWATVNPDKARQAAKEWRDANFGKVRQSAKEWRDANPDKVRQAKKAWRDANPDKVRQAKREWRDANPDKVRQAKKKWNEANPDKVKQSKKKYRDDPAAKEEHFWNHRFIAIDSEGQTYPGNDEWKDGVCFPDHGTYMWCAAGMDTPHQVNGYWLHPRPEYLVHPLTNGLDKRKLGAAEIFDWLLSLPEGYPEVVDRRGRRSSQAIFVTFGSGYDWSQVLSQMSQSNAYEIVKQETMGAKKPIGNFPVYWRNYAINYVKGKWINIWELRDPNNPHKRNDQGELIRDEDGKPITDYIRHIKIYETFSYFQTGFASVVKTMVKQGLATKAEQTLIDEMKAARGDFADYDIEKIMAYTYVECRLLAKQMDEYRKGFADLGVMPVSWHGPGAVANKILQTRNIKKEHYGSDIADALSPQQEFAHYAYFGARIEMIKQGFVDNTILHTYDIASAYPDGTSRLPSLSPRAGRWVHKDAGQLQFSCLADLRTMAEAASMVSMFQIKFKFPEFVKRYRPPARQSSEKVLELTMVRSEFVPFYPVPYRTKGGYILFPSSGYGRYARDDLLAAIAFLERYAPNYPWREKSPSGEPILFQIEEAWVWEPYSADFTGPQIKPFAFLNDMYLKRREIKMRIENGAPYDSREKSYKLCFNSIYGKTAQGVGDEGEVAPYANPYYAMAITASCRRRVVEFALIDPTAVIFFATDGLVTTRPLHTLEDAHTARVRFTTVTTELGDWEYKQAVGGIFVQSGVYAHWSLDEEGKKVATSKLRGASAERYKTDDDGNIWLVKYTLAAWKQAYDSENPPCIIADYKVFKTVGSCLQTPDQWRIAGRWSVKPGEPGCAKRRIDVHGASLKRGINTVCVEEYASTPYHVALRCHSLIDTLPEVNKDQEMSRMRPPDWLSEEWKLADERTNDETEAWAGAGELE